MRKVQKQIRLDLPPLHPTQHTFVNDPHRIVVAACGTKWGKDQPLYSLTPTPGGIKCFGDIHVGDYVFDEAGVPTKVVWESPVFIGNKCFRLTFTDGETVDAGGDHLWTVRHYKHGNERHREWLTLTTQDLLERGISAIQKNGYERYFWQIPTCGPLQWTHGDIDVDLPIDPYCLGLWLGDGGSNGATYTTADDSLVNAWRSAGYSLRQTDKYDYHIESVQDTAGFNAFRRATAALGILGNKHIPQSYAKASSRQRIALLQGLMDTDGHCGERKSRIQGAKAIFYNTNKILAEHTAQLARELGCRVTLREKAAKIGNKHYGACYVVTIRAPFQLFRLARKSARYTPRPVHRSIVSIDQIDSVATKCIKVESPRCLYLTGRGCIPTHNTMGLSIWLLRHAWNNHQSVNWWAAPTLAQSKFAFDYIGRWLPPYRYRVNRAEMAYYLIRSDGSVHSTIQFKSADNPDSLRGAGVNAAVVDEAGYWARDSFISIQTTLTQRQGLLRIISTPKGRNWFYDEWRKGCEDNPKRDPLYASYRLSTASNPYVPRESIEYAQRNMPADAFRQEYLAEFLDESAGVFRNIMENAKSQLYDKPLVGHRYAIGVDWAKHNDYTVFVVGDMATREVVWMERYNDVGWDINIDRCVRLAKRWNNAAVLMDSTGVGDVPFDLMSSVYGQTYGYSISTNAAKKALIQKLQLALERNEISIPDRNIHHSDPDKYKKAETLIEELQMYEYRITPAGIMQFSAPEGYHDDCVIALGLLNWQLAEQPFVYRYSQRAGV